MIPKGGFQSMIKKAQKLQEKMQKVQSELEHITEEGQAAGGLVTIVANGKKIYSSNFNLRYLKTNNHSIRIGITASKKTHDLIPLCHQIPINKVDLSFEFDDANNKISIISYVSSDWKTGVEMEALVAVSVASLTIYDMCKSLDKSIIINKIQLEKKTGGKSGTYIRD